MKKPTATMPSRGTHSRGCARPPVNAPDASPQSKRQEHEAQDDIQPHDHQGQPPP